MLVEKSKLSIIFKTFENTFKQADLQQRHVFCRCDVAKIQKNVL